MLKEGLERSAASEEAGLNKLDLSSEDLDATSPREVSLAYSKEPCHAAFVKRDPNWNRLESEFIPVAQEVFRLATESSSYDLAELQYIPAHWLYRPLLQRHNQDQVLGVHCSLLLCRIHFVGRGQAPPKLGGRWLLLQAIHVVHAHMQTLKAFRASRGGLHACKAAVTQQQQGSCAAATRQQ
ncbi:hypothetical protein DUNSADRAFT_13263 [Dunaliella salina]|uniref:Uncharacterized protein n=1 Tax=Dunaliella salina TaxID=3046 RepID=A0ABQ7G9S4_DUNSA|nr:hypothetical protein DUNSADRAFT_13263 [Dunaliella salina]|eukprot:KAF5831356.1 hypothetical protein DUNSADRAFT_13263 [Dunaliella salina]